MGKVLRFVFMEICRQQNRKNDRRYKQINPTRTGRPPSGNIAKKVVSLAIGPALIKQIDEYAADKKMSRSAAIEAAIVGLLAVKPERTIATAENSLVQPDCIFASPAFGAAILY